MNTLIITEAMLIIKGETTVQLRISAVLLRKAGRWDVPYARYKKSNKKTEELLKKYHINYMVLNGKVVSPQGKIEIKTSYDYIKQQTRFTYVPAITEKI